MKHGEVWTIADPSDATRRVRAAVVSSDLFNGRGQVYCAPILRRPTAGPLPAWAVPLADTDPLSGMVLVSHMSRVPDAAGVEQVGMLTGASMAKVSTALEDLFGL
jgi:mRNA interferase MazF